MKTIYIISGVTGNYDDRHEWLVKAYATEEAAEKFVTAAQEWADELWAPYGDSEDAWGLDFSKNPHDPKGISYDGQAPYYYVAEVPFCE